MSAVRKDRIRFKKLKINKILHIKTLFVRLLQKLKLIAEKLKFGTCMAKREGVTTFVTPSLFMVMLIYELCTRWFTPF